MLYQLRSDKFYSIVPKPEWFIYVLFTDQIRRSDHPCSLADTGVFYDKNLKLKHDMNFSILYTIKDYKFNSYDTKNIDYTLSVINEMKKEIIKHWGNDIKYFILYYNNNDDIWDYMKPILENNGFQAYSIEDFTDKDLRSYEYKTFDKFHPSEYAWDILTPAIVNKLKL